jgi:hypothetical protein
MAAILTREFRTNNLISYINASFSATATSPMYMWFGRSTAWPTDALGRTESTPGFVVPQPNTDTASADFRTNAIAGARIALTEVAPVIERINWTVNTAYNAGTAVITDEWNVYIALRNVVSNTKPTHTDTNDTTNPDWKFLYKITSPAMFSNFVTDEWIPVYFEGNTGTGGNPDVNSVYTVKCITLMVSKSYNTNVISISELLDFRQISLWSNILNTSSAPVTAQKVLAGDINTASGTIVYVDNRLPVYRAVGQTEDYRILIGF